MAEPLRRESRRAGRGVLLRFEPGQLSAIDKAAQAAGLSRTAYLRAAAVEEREAPAGIEGQNLGAGTFAVPLPEDVAVELIAFARLMLSATSGGHFELHFAPGGDITGWKSERGGKVARRR